MLSRGINEYTGKQVVNVLREKYGVRHVNFTIGM
jgi:hypothetical protein